MIRLTDAPWLCLRPFLQTCPGLYVGNETRCRLFVSALCWMARSGAPWRRWPAEYGKGNSVYRRWAAWCARGVWSRRMAYLQADSELSAGLRDSTVVRAHACAVGAPKKKGRDPALGRSRAGFSTQIHILADHGAAPCVCT